MSATHFTIYKLKDHVHWQELIDEFNDEKDADKQYYIRENRDNINYINISSHALYTRQTESNPEWGNVLGALITDLPPIINISNSYILFIQVGTTQFAVTGGNGYQVIRRDKEFNFGIDLLSLLIDRADPVVKRAKERFLTGSILGGDYQLKGKGTLYSETAFNNYFDEIQIELKSSIIRTKLGIQIPTKKKNYSFLAKYSVKFGKSLTTKELDKLLKRIIYLLEEEGYPINPFQLVDKNGRLIEDLNKGLKTLYSVHSNLRTL